MIKEERRRKKRRKIGLYILLILILLIAAGVFIVMNVFTVENVVVEGNELYSSTQIENMVLNDEYSWNSLYVDLKYRFVDIGEVPFVDTMEVSLDNPHTVHIKVYEKGMLGYLYINSIGQNAYFDKDGFVVETSTEVIDGVPKITGISCEEVVLYEKLQLENSDILRDLLNLTQTLKKYNLLPDEIQYDSNMEPVLYYGTIQVKIGSEDNLSQKVVRLSIILPQLDGLNGTLHLETWTPETTDIIWDRAEEQPDTEEETTEDTTEETTEAPSADTPSEEQPAEDTPAEEQPAQDVPAENTPAEEQQPAENAPAEDMLPVEQ
ncbi:cell division protein FtsQ/DivIB [Roseburia inulinivorans]